MGNRFERHTAASVAKQLEGSCLTPEQVALVTFKCKQVRDFEERYFDGNGLDALRELRDAGFVEDSVFNEVYKSVKDAKLTKSFYHEKAMVKAFSRFLESSTKNYAWTKSNKAAKAFLRELCKIKKLKPLRFKTADEIVENWSNKQASAGSTATKKGPGMSSKIENRDAIFERYLTIRKLISEGVPFSKIWEPALMFHRGQISDYVKDGKYCPEWKMKDRVVWCIAGGTVAFEGQYAIPLINHAVKHWFFYSGGADPTELRRKVRITRNANFWYSIDYSQFDATIPYWVIRECFSIIKEFYPQECWNEIDWIYYEFVNTYIVLPGGKVVQKHTGIPSGSFFTQIVGTLSHAYMEFSVLASMKEGEVEEKVSYVRGKLSVPVDGVLLPRIQLMSDDGLIGLDFQLDLEYFSKYVHKIFGVVMNPEKCDHGRRDEPPVYLKRQWFGLYEVRDQLDVFINFVHPEFHRNYSDYSPWHILYGLAYVYGGMVRKSGYLQFLARKMRENHGIPALEKLPVRDLPGPMRGLSKTALLEMRMRAQRDAAAA